MDTNQSHNQFITKTHSLQEAPTPHDIATWLKAHREEDEVLDLLRRAREKYGLTRQLSATARIILGASTFASPERGERGTAL